LNNSIGRLKKKVGTKLANTIHRLHLRGELVEVETYVGMGKISYTQLNILFWYKYILHAFLQNQIKIV
jgi:hypothetical protein